MTVGRASASAILAGVLIAGIAGCTVVQGVDGRGGRVSLPDDSSGVGSGPGGSPAPRRDRRAGLPSDRVDVTGTIVPGPECPAMRGDDGVSYSLSGGGPVRVGERVRIVGSTVMLSTCQFGTTVQVDRLTRL